MSPTVTIDIGTTSIKLCVFDEDGRRLAFARHATPTVRDGWGEIYDVELLKSVVLGFFHGLEIDVRDSVEAVAIAGVGESGGLVRPDLTLASPMIVWHDQRGATYLARMSDAERLRIYRVTGLPVNANYAISKAAWSVTHAGASAAGAQWLNVAEYLAAWMTGVRWSERSLASRTMALDVARGTWSPEICGLLGVDVEIFPELRSASDGSVVTHSFGRDASVPPDVLVHVAGHDHMVGAVGAGVCDGELLNSTGTTEGLLFLKDSPSLGDESRLAKLSNGLSCSGAGYTLFASIPTGGSAFATLQTMCGLSAERLTACLDVLHTRYLAREIHLGRVPMVLPQFRGSAPPTKTAAAKGVIAGVASDTTTEDVVFGCFLGLVRQFRDVLDLFDTHAGRVKVIGPASGNDLWLQLKADLLRTELSVSTFPEVVSRGAQALASSTSLDWSECQPRDVLVDAQRAAELNEWCDSTRTGWEYLKGVPI